MTTPQARLRTELRAEFKAYIDDQIKKQALDRLANIETRLTRVEEITTATQAQVQVVRATMATGTELSSLRTAIEATGRTMVETKNAVDELLRRMPPEGRG